MTNTKPILRDLPLPITTPRLTIREVREGDGKAIYDAKKESLDDLKPWMGWAQCEKDDLSVEEGEVTCRKKAADFLRRDELMMLAFDKKSGELVGCTGFHNIDWDIPRLEIGFWVRSSRSGKGFATEITKALSLYAFKALGANCVGITHSVGNMASQKVIEKCGFEYEGTLRRDTKVGDKLYDSMFYSLLEATNVPDIAVTW